MDKVSEFWNKYIEEKNLAGKVCYAGEMVFGIDDEMSAVLTALVLSGKKRASTSVLEAYKIDNEKLPKADEYYVLTDWDGNPLGILREIKVSILPYNQVTWEMAQKEGEDDCLESWRENHDDAFEEDAAITGFEFTPDMPVVFEEFELVYRA